MKFFPWVLFAFIFAIYVAGVSRTVFAGDNGDVLISYFFGALSHPPGYPLNTVIGFLISHLPYSAPFAFKANVVSALLLAAVVSFVFLIIKNLTRSFLAAFAGSLILSFTPLFWFYAHIAEVFQLNLLLLSISIFSLIIFWKGKKRKQKLLFLSVFFWGLAVFNHQTSLLLAPSYLYLLFEFGRRNKPGGVFFLKLFGCFLLGLLPYLFIFWPSSGSHPLGWVDRSSSGSVFGMITRANYGTFVAAPDLVGFSLAARLVQVWWFIKVIVNDFTPMGLILVIAGSIWLYRNERLWFWFLSIGLFFSGPFFLAYASFPPVEDFQKGTAERFLLTSYLLYAIILGVGIWGLWQFLSRLLSRRLSVRRSIVVFSLSSLFLLMPILMARFNFAKTTLADNKIGSLLAFDILKSAQPPGIIFLQGDTVIFNVEYLHFVEKENSGSKLVALGRLARLDSRKALLRYYPGLVQNKTEFLESKPDGEKYFNQIIAFNFDKHPIYSTSQIKIPADYLWVNQGILFRLYKKDSAPDDSTVASTIKNNLNNLAFTKDTYRDMYWHFFDQDVKRIYSSVYLLSAYSLLNRNDFEGASKYFVIAGELDPESLSARYGLGVSQLERMQCSEAKDTFEAIISKDQNYASAWDAMAEFYNRCEKNPELSQSAKEKARQLRKSNVDVGVEKL